MRPAGIRDVAALAGVSISTVSSALNRPDRVSPRAARVVTEAARALGYVPDSAAKALRTGGGQLLALAFADLGDPLAAETACGAIDTLAEAGHPALVVDGAGSAMNWERAFVLLLGHRVDGLLIDGGRTAPPTAALVAARCSVVMRLGTTDALHGDLLDAGIDHRADGFRAVSILLSGGGRRVLVVTGAEDSAVRDEVLEGCLAATTILGARLRTLAIDEPTPAAGRRAGVLLAGGPSSELPEGVLCTDASIALGLLRALVDAGIDVPQRVAVLALGDHPLAEGGPVPLSVLRPASRRLGSRAATALLDGLAGRSTPDRIRLASEVVARASTPALPR